MATAILKIGKGSKTTKAKNEAQEHTKTIQRAAILLKQVSDPTRLQVVSLLAEGERHVGGLCDQLNNLSQPAVSHHLTLLRVGGIVARRRQGKNNFYSLTETGYQLSKIVKGVAD